MEKDEKVYLDMDSWSEENQKLGETFNGKTLKEVRSLLSEKDSKFKDDFIILMLELAMNQQDNNDRNHRMFIDPLLRGDVTCRYR
jgi:hypothetical protein